MNLLLLTHRVPYPPDRGDRIRAHQLLLQLGRLGRVSLASVSQEPISQDTQDFLHDNCCRVAIERSTTLPRLTRTAWSMARGRSATEGYFWSPRLAATVRAWARAEPFDAVVCYCSGMYRYTRLRELRGVRRVVDLVDVDSQKWSDCAAASRGPKSEVHRIEAGRVRRLEQRIARDAEEVVVISHRERDQVIRDTGRTSVRVATNGVDLDYFRPHDTQSIDAPPQAEPETCCFVGVLNYQPNVDAVCWFVREVWPAILKERPAARLRLVGRTPSPVVRRAAETPGVELHANVPDVRPFVARSSVVVAPLRIARGVQNKVLEAMALGKPVIVSPPVLSGINATPGRDLLVAESAAQWQESLNQLFSSQVERDTLAERARAFVEANHNWQTCLAPLIEGLRLETQQHQEPADKRAGHRRGGVVVAS